MDDVIENLLGIDLVGQDQKEYPNIVRLESNSAFQIFKMKTITIDTILGVIASFIGQHKHRPTRIIFDRKRLLKSSLYQQLKRIK